MKGRPLAIRQASRAVVNIPAIGVQRDLFTLNLYQIRKGPVPDCLGYQRQHHHQFSRYSECRYHPSDFR